MIKLLKTNFKSQKTFNEKVKKQRISQNFRKKF